MKHSPRVVFYFWNVLCPYVSVASPAWGSTWTLSSVFGSSFTKRPAASAASGSHQKKSFRPHGSEVSVSSSSSFCLAAARANPWTPCSFIHKLLILFNHCAKINNHGYPTLQCLKLCINTTLLLDFVRIQSTVFFCSKKYFQNTFSSIHLYERTAPWNSHAIFNGR